MGVSKGMQPSLTWDRNRGEELFTIDLGSIPEDKGVSFQALVLHLTNQFSASKSDAVARYITSSHLLEHHQG